MWREVPSSFSAVKLGPSWAWMDHSGVVPGEALLPDDLIKRQTHDRFSSPDP